MKYQPGFGQPTCRRIRTTTRTTRTTSRQGRERRRELAKDIRERSMRRERSRKMRSSRRRKRKNLSGKTRCPRVSSVREGMQLGAKNPKLEGKVGKSRGRNKSRGNRWMNLYTKLENYHLKLVCTPFQIIRSARIFLSYFYAQSPPPPTQIIPQFNFPPLPLSLFALFTIQSPSTPSVDFVACAHALSSDRFMNFLFEKQTQNLFGLPP
mmetsp:Transcript_31814/g.101528  ORF Transcript_31814/g.101528 Transcript_31814/m.101528 type:complete len:209 (-) Transcript_31814:459-1085(-)